MSDEKIADAFKGYPFLENLPHRLRMNLVSGAAPFRASAGDLLGREGQTAHKFYLIKEGRVNLELHKPDEGVVTVQSVGPGEIVGWSWLVPPHQWRFDCRAADDVAGLAFDAVWLREQCEKNHELGYHLIRELLTVVAGRLAATRVRLLDLYK